jgi:signal transduction histidine kinase
MTQLHFDFDIPAVWTAVAHWAAYMMFISLLPKRLKKVPTVLIALLFLPVQIALYSVIAPLRGMAFNLSMVLFALWTLFPFIVLTDIPFWNRLYYCARSFILGGFTAALAWQVYYFYSTRYSMLDSLPWEILLMLVIGSAVIVGTWLIERIHRNELRQMPLSLRHVFETILIALSIYILSSFSYTSIDSPFSANSAPQVFMIRTMVYFSGLAILFALHLHLCDTYSRTERDALQRILDQQYENDRIRQESMNLVNQKYHDLKHQLAVLRSEIDTADKLEAIDRMESELRSYEAQNKTGNDVLDAILAGKSLYCQEHGITLTVVADGAALNFMHVVDLSAIFGNALDNAIEAVEQVSDPEQRLIHLSVARQKGFLRIQVRNRYTLGPTTPGTLPETTKQDRRNHGYGLKSIRQTVERYGGTIAVHGADGWFELGILLPLDTPAPQARQEGKA